MTAVGIEVGTSGWQYADWREVFYPRKLPQRRWLEFYSQTFTTVEINSTFYRLPTLQTVQRWADNAPAGFVATIKASRYLTHVKRLQDPAEPIARLMSVLEPLRAGGKLGPVLLQTPPGFAADVDLLEQTLRTFPEDIAVAFEPRDPSWFGAPTRAVLESHNAAWVWADRGGDPVGPIWLTADWCYLRLHHGRHDWRYGEADLERWAERMRTVGSGFAYTNNDPGGVAVADAIRLRSLIDGTDLTTPIRAMT